MKRYEELFDTQGRYITDPFYKEILKLDQMLTQKKIPHILHKMMDGWQVIYPEDGTKRVMDAIEHYGSYGNEYDLLEIMGLLTEEERDVDSVLGHLTAEEVFQRIVEHWKATHSKYITPPPVHIDREAWEPCRACGSCDSCFFSCCDKRGEPCRNCRSQDHNRYRPLKFCPKCGRPLTETAWAELEKRLVQIEKEG